MMQYYILFKNHTDGTALYQKLKSENINAIIAPTPRKLSVSCGISLMINEKDINKIKEIAQLGNFDYIKIEGLQSSFNNVSNKYC